MRKEFLGKVVLSTVVLTGTVIAPVLENSHFAKAEEQQKEEFGQLEKINRSEATIKLNKGFTYAVNDNGTASITKVATGETKNLPSSAKDMNGKSVTLSYIKSDKGLKMMVIDDSQSVQFYGWKKGLKCGLGTAGGAGTVGLAGFGVAGPAGAVVGAVSGGMSGAAASCF
ncbi:hypothetical protein K2V61_07730 [Staphylococcus simulans]|uniref:hypothetical protein n=1 Tax=Staphylococcus simulans TaxID=1286 RepID=UPI001E3242B3|nr:hypothetical protein [Staphylococcus simulans]MCD8915429.1 hypothetical protein [Staphylococcus simulans]